MAGCHDVMLVEGAGGILAPITADALIIDLIRLLNLPLIVIARSTLGTINHTFLTVRQAENAGITVSGIILNRTAAKRDEAEKTNPGVIRKFSGVSLLGRMPYIPEAKRKNPAFLANRALSCLDLALFM